MAFSGSVGQAQTVSKDTLASAMQACGAGVNVSAQSTFESAFDATSVQTPGQGTADLEIFGVVLENILSTLESDEAKVAVLKMYYDCIEPKINPTGPTRGDPNDILTLFASDSFCDRTRFLVESAARVQFSNYRANNPVAESPSRTVWTLQPFLVTSEFLDLFFTRAHRETAKSAVIDFGEARIAYFEPLFDPIYVEIDQSMDFYEDQLETSIDACLHSGWVTQKGYFIYDQDTRRLFARGVFEGDGVQIKVSGTMMRPTGGTEYFGIAIHTDRCGNGRDFAFNSVMVCSGEKFDSVFDLLLKD